GVRYEENIPDNIHIEYYDDIQFDDNEEESIQVENDEYDDENNEFNENNREDDIYYMNSPSSNSMQYMASIKIDTL
ncbi:8356_t:CDS:2, partial [Racocetra fulgida]